MDVFALSKHEYLQPPVSKHGRSSNVQQQQQQSSSHQSTPVSSGNNQGSGGGTGGGAGQTSFSTGMFGTMNQSSSS
jgi:tousled-like kinase